MPIIRKNAYLKPHDYMYILRYYNESIPKTRKNTIHKRETKKKALRILKKKMCSCKKKLQQQKINKCRSIATCTKSILNNKGFSPTGTISCNKTIKQYILGIRKNPRHTRKKNK